MKKFVASRQVMCSCISGLCFSPSSSFRLFQKSQLKKIHHRSIYSMRSSLLNNQTRNRMSMKITEDEIYLAPTLERIQSKISRNKSSPQQLPSDLLINGLAASHLGLDPSRNLRHAPMVYHKNYSFDNWPTSHTFPMDKFRMTAHSLLNDLDESSGNEEPLVQSPTDFYNPLPFHEFPTSLLSPPIDKSFLHSFLNGKLTSEECRLIGFREQTSRPEVIERTVLEVVGTILTAQLALKYGLASHLAGGTHHAESRRGKGFTIINDLACAAYLMTWRETDCSDNLRWMRELYRGENAVERVLVVDCDVHQGDGTATFHNTESRGLNGKIFTLDLHAASNYPHPKEKCTYDISIPDGCNDERYMELLTESLEKALVEVEPKLVLYNAGVDPFEHDKLGRLSLTWEGLQKRDYYVISKCVDKGLPVACVVGGGYDVDVKKLGKRHALVHRVCGDVWREKQMWRIIGR